MCFVTTAKYKYICVNTYIISVETHIYSVSIKKLISGLSIITIFSHPDLAVKLILIFNDQF